MNLRALSFLLLMLSATPGQALGQGGPQGAAPPGSVTASASAPVGDADQRYAEAQEHFLAGRYTQALPIFRALHAESGSPNASLYVARCLREMGQLADAYDQMLLTEREASARAQSEERFAATRDSARSELRDLEARVGRVTLDVPSRPAGLEIEINGGPLTSERWGAVLPVVPGMVRVWATAPGHATVRQEIDVAAGSAQTVTVLMVPSQASGPRPPLGVPTVGARPEVPPVPDASTGGLPPAVTGGVVAVCLGVLGMGTFAVSGILANQKFSDVKERCGGERCVDPAMNDSIDAGRRLDTVANVGLGVGLVGLAVGATLIAVGLATAEPAGPAAAPKPTGRIWLGATPSGGTLGFAAVF